MNLSVILPVYNAGLYLKESIISILNQTYSDFELIIINDGSTDNSSLICKSFDDNRIVYVEQNNLGLARTLNKGLKLAKGKYIARMDADDIALPKRFEIQMNYLINNPDVVLLGAAVILIDKDGSEICIDVPFTGDKFLKWYMQTVGNPFKHPTVMFDRLIAIDAGGYNEKIGKYFEDYFLWNELAHQNKKIDIIRQPLLKYRITPGSIMSSIKSKKFSEFMLNIIEKRSFSDFDLERMINIKEEEKSIKNDNGMFYQKRIDTARKGKVNFIYSKFGNYFSSSFLLCILGFIRKLRVLPIMISKKF